MNPRLVVYWSLLSALLLAPSAAAEDAAEEKAKSAASPVYLLRYQFRKGETIRWKVVHQALDQHRPAAQIKGVQLLSSVYEELPDIQGDAWRLQQVISNLIGNALKFTPPLGHVVVVLVQRADVAEISVRDNGRGIEPSAIGRIFDPYVKLGAHAADGGMGLGLYIARRLVELHGGTIRVHSAGDGFGCTFTVRLPLTAADAR